MSMNTFVWNNRAVMHLRSGNSSTAVLVLLKAVFQLRKARARRDHAKQILKRVNSADSSASETGGSDSTGTPAAKKPKTEEKKPSIVAAASASAAPASSATAPLLITSVPTCNSEWAMPPQSRSSSTVFRFFDHAFVPCSNSPPEGAHFRPLAYAMLLYNTGLALHTRGLEEHHQGGPAASLHLAVKFYTSALKILEDSCDDGTSGEIVLLLLAIYNNLGHIQGYFFNVSEATRCVEWLRALTDAKSNALLPEWGPQEKFFKLNRILIPPGDVFSLAPAA